MMRWFALCTACLAVYWLPVMAGSADGKMFFVVNGFWSLLLCGVVLAISGSKAAIGIAVLEFSAIAVNLVCAWQYMTAKGWLYSAYSEVIEAIVIAEIVVLVMGAPWDAVCRMVRECWGSVNHWGSAYLRGCVDREAHH